MNIGTAFLSGTNCPSGSSSSTTGGPTTFELRCDGYTAEYSLTMTLTSATSATVNTLCAGTWTLLYGSAVVCGSTPIELGALAFGPQASGTVSTLDSPSGVPLALTFDTSGGDLFLVRQGCTNTYGNVFAPLAFGVIPDATGQPLILNLAFQAYAVTSQLMTGVGILTGAGPATSCSTVFTYTLTALGPC